jgi:hypothetical protein
MGVCKRIPDDDEGEGIEIWKREKLRGEDGGVK